MPTGRFFSSWDRWPASLSRASHRTPGRYKTIEVFDPEHRIVSTAPFRDRVVHHAFCAVCEPLFERGFIHASYANRKGSARWIHKGRYSDGVLACAVAFCPARPRRRPATRTGRKVADHTIKRV